jgi:hypothetical protein
MYTKKNKLVSFPVILCPVIPAPPPPRSRLLISKGSIFIVLTHTNPLKARPGKCSGHNRVLSGTIICLAKGFTVYHSLLSVCPETSNLSKRHFFLTFQQRQTFQCYYGFLTLSIMLQYLRNGTKTGSYKYVGINRETRHSYIKTL